MPSPTPVQIKTTAIYRRWLAGLRDIDAKRRIAARLERLQLGQPGDVKSVGEGVFEIRLHFGPGYRLYFIRRGHVVIVLLCAGDKASQASDIRLAHQLAKDTEVGDGS